MKNKYVLRFLHRGMLFGGFGPIIAGIVYLCISLSVEGFSLTGGEVLIAILSTYLLAFLQAGASVFNQIEQWPLAKSLFFHFFTVYVAYIGCYLLNSWIPFEPLVLLIFTLVFALTYAIIWLSVFLAIRATSKRFNAKLK
ncbi:MAG: DUF3021 domain-containing protein [Clostridia bacterium]|nr:DUF3021 domain-containing protein [Clostridia bacterium]